MPCRFASSGTVATSRSASRAILALNVASNFLRDFVISVLHRLRQSRTLHTLTFGPISGVHFSRLAGSDFFDDRKLLSGVTGPHRHDEPATHFKLLNQRRRWLPERGGHHDGVKRTAFGPATIAVAKPDAYVVIREVSECFRGGLGQWRDNLDGADLSRQVRKDGSLIARTRTDFEHNMIGRDLGQLGHQGHDARLRYGLAV